MFQNSFHKIPNEMKTYRQWVCWRYQWHTDDWKHERKPTKIPYSIDGRLASVTDPSTWATFDEVVAMMFGCDTPVEHFVTISASGFSGIGFVLTLADPYTICDLDNTHGDQIALERQMKVFQEFDSYSESSPSGHGLHIIVKGSIPKGRRRAFIELYSNERYMTMTGNVYKDAPIAERQEVVNILWKQLGGNVDTASYDGNTPQKEDDTVILERARGATNGAKFSALYDGDWLTINEKWYGPKHGHDGNGTSEADFGLIDIISFYTQNKDQIRRMFLASQLGKRDKVKRWKYIDDMINASFDRMLPPIDMTGMQEQLQFQLTEAERRKELENLSKAQPQPELPVEPMLPFMPPVETKEHLSKLPPGLMGQIANFVFQSSPTPVPEIALAAAIGLMAGISGRAYNISGAGLNQYILVLAPTGSGKEALSTGISQLMEAIKLAAPTASEFIGPGNIRSDAALLKWLAKRPCFVSIIGEFGLKLKQISSQNANSHETGLRQTILDLYNKSGAGKQLNPLAYSEQEKNTAIIKSPSFTLLGESTPETFYNALDENMITEGLLPRFTIIEYQGLQPPLNKKHHLFKPDWNLCDELAKFAATCTSLNHDNKTIVVNMTDEAQELLDELREFARSQTNNAEREIVRQLWSRINMKTLKLAALVAVGCDNFAPVITLDHAKWAKSLIIADVMNILRRFNRGDIGKDTEETKQERVVKKAIIDYVTKPWEEMKSYSQGDVAQALHSGRVIPGTYISRKVGAMSAFRHDPRGVTVSIKRTIDNLIAGDVIREVPPGDMQKFGTRQKGYMVSEWSALNTD
jgi:hypothetical protein